MRKYALLPMLLLAMTTILLSQEQLEVEGAIIIENSSDPTPSVGTIRWNGNDFEGFTNSGWKSLTGCDCCQCNYGCQDIELFNDYSNGAIADQIHVDDISTVDCYNSVEVSFNSSSSLDTILAFTSFGPNLVSQSVYYWQNGLIVDSCSFNILTQDCSVSPGASFSCNGLMIELVNGTSTVHVDDFIDVGSCSNYTFAFSSSQADTLRTFTCANIGDIQITFFVFENGVFDQACFAISEIIDPSGSCLSAPCNGSGIYTCSDLSILMGSPSILTLNVYDVADLGTCRSSVTAAFSSNPADTLRTYTCADIGTIQHEITFWENGSMTPYKCYATHTLSDPNGLCQQCNGDTYTCNEPVFNMTATNPPSFTIGIYDIVDIDVCTGNLSAAFSANPADQFRTYGCTNVGDIQITIFIFENGVFLEPCFSLITLLDPAGFCQ